MKIALISVLAGLVLLVSFLIPTVSYDLKVDRKSDFTNDSYTVRVSQPVNTVVSDIQPDLRDELGTPALFQYLLESEFVVVASRVSMLPVRKLSAAADSFDFADWPGVLDNYQVQELLYSRESFEAGKHLDDARFVSFQVYRRHGNLIMNVENNIRYLIFLESVAKDDEIFSELDLNREKPLFRPYVGKQSIFPGPGDPVHGKRMLGRIDLRSQNDTELVERIRRFCLALKSGDINDRRRNLATLAGSKDEVLRENAEYAIRYLSRKSKAGENNPN